MNDSLRFPMTAAALGLALLLALPARAGSPAAPEPSQDPLAFARGAKAWSENCGRCHNLRSPKELQDAEWAVSVTHMRLVAGLPGDMARDIRAFLQATN